MKAVTLFLFRLCLGAHLLACAGSRFASPSGTMDVAGGFYIEAFSSPLIQQGLGILCGALGVFMILGFLRVLTYPLTALTVAAGAVTMGMAVVTPLTFQPDVALAIEAMKTFTPLLGFFLLSLAPLVWWRDDWLALDRIGGSRMASEEEALAPAMIDFPIEREMDYQRRDPVFASAPHAAAAHAYAGQAQQQEFHEGEYGQELPSQQAAYDEHQPYEEEPAEAEYEYAESDTHAELAEAENAPAESVHADEAELAEVADARPGDAHAEELTSETIADEAAAEIVEEEAAEEHVIDEHKARHLPA